MAQATRLDGDVALFIDETGTDSTLLAFRVDMALATTGGKRWAKAVKDLMTAGHPKADAEALLRDAMYAILEGDVDTAGADAE